MKLPLYKRIVNANARLKRAGKPLVKLLSKGLNDLNLQTKLLAYDQSHVETLCA
jgi:hypothetical protein